MYANIKEDQSTSHQVMARVSERVDRKHNVGYYSIKCKRCHTTRLNRTIENGGWRKRKGVLRVSGDTCRLCLIVSSSSVRGKIFPA